MNLEPSSYLFQMTTEELNVIYVFGDLLVTKFSNPVNYSSRKVDDAKVYAKKDDDLSFLMKATSKKKK